MENFLIAMPKLPLAHFLKSKIEDSIGTDYVIKVRQTLPENPLNVDILLIHEQLALRLSKKKFTYINMIRRESPKMKILVFGLDNIELRIQSKIEGANEYVALQMLTHDDIGPYLSKIILGV